MPGAKFDLVPVVNLLYLVMLPCIAIGLSVTGVIIYYFLPVAKRDTLSWCEAIMMAAQQHQSLLTSP